MNNTTFFGFLPTSDGTVYVDNYGHINERIGIAYINNGTGNPDMKFINPRGYIDDFPGENPLAAILGKKGETITLRRLGMAFRYAEEPRDVIENAEKYFTVDKDNLPDTIVFSLDTDVVGKFVARIDVMTSEFPYLGTNFVDLSDANYRVRKDDRTSDTLKELLIPVLHAYADVIGKRPNVEVYFKKACEHDMDSDELEMRNKEIAFQEELFLPRLRRFINEKLDEAMEEDRKYEEEHKARSLRSEDIRNRFLTKYDLDPNLY